MRIQIPAGNILKGINSLKIWGATSEVGQVVKVLVTESEEAKRLKESFNIDGSLAGIARKGTTIDSSVSADQAAKQIIYDMGTDLRLDPSEKTTWRQAWVDISAGYTKALAYAVGLVVSTDSFTTAYSNLQSFLINAGVWAKPDISFILSGSELSDASAAYSLAYRTLSDACTDKVAYNAELAAKVYAEGEATDAAEAAQLASKAYADAELSLQLITANAYADGVATAAELTAIAEAQVLSDAAKAAAIAAGETYATAASNAAEAAAVLTSNAYADGIVTASEQATITYAEAYADSVRVAADAYADGIVTASETAIITAYQAYTDAAKANAIVVAGAYTDGEVFASEATIIAAYQAYTDAAKQAAITTANVYADGIVTASEAASLAAANVLADAARQEAIATAGSYADGIVTISEANAIAAAKTYTDAAKVLAETTAAAYADGVVTAAEARAIADATAKANAAQATAILYTEGWSNYGATNDADIRIPGKTTINGGILETGSVTAAKVSADVLAVTTARINNLAVTNAKIGNLAITEAKIDSLAVTNAKIKDAAITNAKIGSLAVDTLKIKDQAVTIPVSVSASSGILLTGSWKTILSCTITSTGAPIYVSTSGSVTQISATYSAYFRLVRDGVVVSTVYPSSTVYSSAISFALSETPGAGIRTYSLQAYTPSLATIYALSRSIFLLEVKK